MGLYLVALELSLWNWCFVPYPRITTVWATDLEVRYHRGEGFDLRHLYLLVHNTGLEGRATDQRRPIHTCGGVTLQTEAILKTRNSERRIITTIKVGKMKESIGQGN
ncbi:hypothetical protein J6590_068304 [Homalodisca vitripennis]|nr:hypothetical protein J6590_068304 [Homalodisca vitripennis]